MQLRGLTLHLNKFAEASEGFVPLLGNGFQVSARFLQATLFQLPDSLAATPCAVHEARSLQHEQVFADCLPGNVRTRRKTRYRHRPAVAETRNDT